MKGSPDETAVGALQIRQRRERRLHARAAVAIQLKRNIEALRHA